KAEKVLAPRGTKNVYQFSNSDKHQITVLACMNAAGFYIEPMLIFPNTRFRYNPLDGAPDTWCVGRSGNGWMNSEVFYEWIANHFVPEVQQKKIPFPIVLFIDGHSSHGQADTVKYLFKSPDSTPQTGTTAVLAAGCSIAEKSTAYETALRVLEESMTEEKVWLFKRRLNEGYDFDTDTFYNAWKKIKLQADGSNTSNIQATGSNTADEIQATTGINTDDVQAATGSNTIDVHHHATTTPSPAAKKRTNVSEALDKHLRYPTAHQVAPKMKKRKPLPHAISGRVFIQYLEDKKREKEIEETRKRVNREKRAAKKAQNEATKKTPRRKRTTEEVDEQREIDENMCAKCKKPYEDDDDNWIGCEFCERWFHKECTDIMDAAELSDTELSELEWQCDHCMEK
ncbi:hypothetical protein BSL78_25043, partial [Apostichopus japonicus]